MKKFSIVYVEDIIEAVGLVENYCWISQRRYS
jgi:hypothetical protein